MIYSLSKSRILALLLASGFAITLLFTRFFMADAFTYGFLAWNLFLAWIPLGFAWLAIKVADWKWPTWSQWVFMFGWLLFFPNAPYLLTDLGHLARITQWNVVPLGFDVVMLLSFVINGFVLAFLSLFLLENVWIKRFNTKFANCLSVAVLVLTGFGMYIGRFLRWNSWDIFFNPISIFTDAVTRLTSPIQHPRTWGFTLLYSSFLVMIYLSIKLWRRQANSLSSESCKDGFDRL